MGEIINRNATDEIIQVNGEDSLIKVTQELLMDARTALESPNTLSVPITELATLGSGVSSLIPAFNTVTQTTTIAADGLYKVANAATGDVLKAAQDGKFYGAIKAADGGSKLAQLQAADTVTATTKSVAAFNPATIMMSAALYSLEREIKQIEEAQKQILNFLEIEKESEIEADVETLMSIVSKYKMNWNNEHYVASNHKMVLDIQKNARKNMLAYQKKVSEITGKKQFFVAQPQVNHAVTDLEKKFKYYRLSLYTFALSSLMEIMLSGNFKESYIEGIKKDIQAMTEAYRSAFEKGSRYLEKISNSALEANVLKGVGTAGKAVGKVIGAIPLIKEGPVDEFLQDSGAHLKENAADIAKEAVHRFAAISNPGTGVFLDKMDDMIQIYNHTKDIYFDDKRIYLVTDKTA